MHHLIFVRLLAARYWHVGPTDAGRRDPHLWVTVLGLVLYAAVAALLISLG
ncbi:MAG: hypothetical protein ACRDWG_03730 [Actinomycetes bacterium]